MDPYSVCEGLQTAKSGHPCVLEIAVYFDISAAGDKIGCVIARNMLIIHKSLPAVP